jgi:hypothetical protein
MLNSFQKQTGSGKPVINKHTKLPEFERSVFSRIKAVKEQLGIFGKPTDEQREEMLYNELSLISM